MHNNIKKSDDELSHEIARLQQKIIPCEKISVRALIFMGLCIVITFATIFIGDSEGATYFGAIIASISAIISLVFTLLSKSYQKSIQKLLKENSIISDVLSNYFTLHSYDKNSHIPKSIIKDLKLTASFNRLTGSDYVKGEYNGAAFEYCDIYLDMQRTQGENSTTTTDVFKGLWLIYDLKEAASERLTIFEAPHRKNKGVPHTNNALFNERYSVKTNTPYLENPYLTEAFIEGIMGLNDRLGASIVVDVFKDKLCITVCNYKDNYELSLQKIEDIGTLRKKFQDETAYVVDILDTLSKINL